MIVELVVQDKNKKCLHPKTQNQNIYRLGGNLTLTINTLLIIDCLFLTYNKCE